MFKYFLGYLNMIVQFMILLILYLLLNQTIQYLNDTSDKIPDQEQEQEQDKNSEEELSEESEKKNKKKNKSKKETIPLKLFGEPHDYKEGEYISWVFNQPTPWTQILYAYGQEYPFKFFIKVRIPSLNDYQSWKEIIPNLDFNASTGELIIPSKNEASALALANLIITNFKGQLQLKTILEKNLIQISVGKAQEFEVVRTKLREQILETIQGKSKLDTNNQVSNNDYEEDLAKRNVKASNIETVEDFGNNEPVAATGNEGFSYI